MIVFVRYRHLNVFILLLLLFQIAVAGDRAADHLGLRSGTRVFHQVCQRFIEIIVEIDRVPRHVAPQNFSIRQNDCILQSFMRYNHCVDSKMTADFVGMELPGKPWHVVRRLNRAPSLTGGNYSDGYIVQNQAGESAFLKAFDFSEARNSPDEAIAIQAMINAYVYERELLKRCGAQGMDRIVRAIDSGKIDCPGEPGGMVFYLIFEAAIADARELMDQSRNLDLSWRLQTLHQITVALNQLHSAQIAHQDIKPSNVLSFGNNGSKLADLGRACSATATAPHAHYHIAGDPDYAPPESLYNWVSEDWNTRRLGCDLYLLGSMVVYLFTNQATTHLLISTLPPDLLPTSWGDTYSLVLPFIRNSFHHVIESFASHISNASLRDALVPVVQQLCDPDPSLRGYPGNRSPHRNRYSLEQYMSLFDRLAYQSRVGILKAQAHATTIRRHLQASGAPMAGLRPHHELWRTGQPSKTSEPSRQNGTTSAGPRRLPPSANTIDSSRRTWRCHCFQCYRSGYWGGRLRPEQGFTGHRRKR